MRIADIMSRNVTMINLDTNLVEAARRMQAEDVGALPVNDGEKIRGMVTDRDIVIRAIAVGKDLNQTRARDVMTEKVRYVFEDEDVSVASDAMKDKQIRRLIVLNREKRLVGLVSLGDLALKSESEHLSADTVRRVSEPTQQQAALH